MSLYQRSRSGGSPGRGTILEEPKQQKCAINHFLSCNREKHYYSITIGTTGTKTYGKDIRESVSDGEEVSQ